VSQREAAQIAGAAEALAEYTAIRRGLEGQRERRTAAGTLHRAAMVETGVLLRRAKRLAQRHPDLAVGITGAQEITGLTRPTLYKLLRDEDLPDDSGADPARMSDAALAAAHAGYGYGHHDAIDTEFWARFPHLNGWHLAIRHLADAHYERERERLGEAWDPLSLEGEPAAGTQDLMDGYRRAVDEIAEKATLSSTGHVIL
jgi:hypothetical protein